MCVSQLGTMKLIPNDSVCNNKPEVKQIMSYFKLGRADVIVCMHSLKLNPDNIILRNMLILTYQN